MIELDYKTYLWKQFRLCFILLLFQNIVAICLSSNLLWTNYGTPFLPLAIGMTFYWVFFLSFAQIGFFYNFIRKQRYLIKYKGNLSDVKKSKTMTKWIERAGFTEMKKKNILIYYYQFLDDCNKDNYLIIQLEQKKKYIQFCNFMLSPPRFLSSFRKFVMESPKYYFDNKSILQNEEANKILINRLNSIKELELLIRRNSRV